MAETLTVNPTLQIPLDELEFTFARSSGPGGQNVNKVNSKAVLHWNPSTSLAWPAPEIRWRFLQRHAARITNDGDVVIMSQRYRDQPKNIDDCLEKLRGMIAEILSPPKKRRPTKPTKGSQQRRLNEKKLRSETKSGRKFRAE